MSVFYLIKMGNKLTPKEMEQSKKDFDIYQESEGFDLSKKIHQREIHKINIFDDVQMIEIDEAEHLPTSSVKEFIRLLKDMRDLDKYTGFSNAEKFINKINKRAGKELI